MNITVAGGDMRMLVAGQMLADAGVVCRGFGFENRKCPFPTIEPREIPQAIAQSTAVLLPLPCEKEGYLNTPFSEKRFKLQEIVSFGTEATLFIGGRLPFVGDRFIDYSVREDFQIENAVPTAEGAIALAMKEMDITLFGSKALVTGYGRIGKYL